MTLEIPEMEAIPENSTQTLKVASSLSFLKNRKMSLQREEEEEGHEMPLLLLEFGNHPRFPHNSVTMVRVTEMCLGTFLT